ncbi:unnamed protein product [Rotaria magnacalcarata]|uniref:Antistasin-like domain-containing protein n=1 Tax=Rotaria magnacalcarata TaxID=392030 RepID=A0A816W206_9BILA|nr:unnamed protein product [Rotaria magnacalcarata]CAF4055914.1 unnamed protein product [Rotaria magnacalcarata]
MNYLIIFLFCIITPLSVGKSIEAPVCGPVCAIYCRFGNVMDENGCPTCVCKRTPCEDNQPPLAGYNCGRSPNRQPCPSTHYCNIAPNDAYAVCCPRR